jgi:hypothetical protein
VLKLVQSINTLPAHEEIRVEVHVVRLAGHQEVGALGRSESTAE